MKKFLFALTLVFSLLMVFGCSDNSNITAPDDTSSVVLVQRPEFIDTRPQSVQAAFTMTASASDDQVYEKKPPPPPDPGGDDPNPNPAHKYAYVVGISDYEGTANDLQYADDDAQDMTAYFRSQGFTVVSDLDRNATADEIVAGLQWLAASAAPGDEIAFAYSGHGVKLSVGSCIISTDLYYIAHDYIMDIFNSANCTKMLFTIDACQAGSFLSDGITGSVVAAASNNTYSYDAPTLGNGAWTYYFLQAANGSYVFAEDIATQAENGMRAWAKIYHVRVSPAHTDKYTGSFDI